MEWIKKFFKQHTSRGNRGQIDGVVYPVPDTGVNTKRVQPRSLGVCTRFSCCDEFANRTAEGGATAFDIKGNPELLRRLHAVTSGTPTIYDERGYPGGMPTLQAARLLLEDFATGLAIPHANIQPGWKERLESVAAGRHVDPSFWQR